MNELKEFKVIDLFAGAGGFGLGFKLAHENFKIICSVEVDRWAADTLLANNAPNKRIICGDITEYNTAEKILGACIEIPDVIIGGPPCQGFSYAGPAKDPKDPRNSLFKNFAQWVDVLRPKVFVMENVRGLLTGKNEKGEKVIDIITDTFNSIGYTVNIWELNAANYGVPQNRERIFIVGNKYGKKLHPPIISHYLPSEIESLKSTLDLLTPAINVIDAIGDLPELFAGEGEEIALYKNQPSTEFQNFCRNDASILSNHVTMKHTKRMVERYQRLLDGLTMNEIPNELKVRKRNGNGELSDKEYNSNYRHLRPDMISYTIPASFYSNFIHPVQPRNITSREAARLQSFPDSYIFKGKRTQISSKLLSQLGKEDQNYLSQYNQIGNAVPPLLAKAVATQILEYLVIEENFEESLNSVDKNACFSS